jgi:hypothetical protein
VRRYIGAVFADDKAVGVGRSKRFWNSLIFVAKKDLIVPVSAHDARRQETYAFDSFIPLVVDVLKTHYKPQRYPDTIPLHGTLVARVIAIVESSLPHLQQRKHLLAVNELLFLLSSSGSLESGITQMATSGIMRKTRERIQFVSIEDDPSPLVASAATGFPSEFLERSVNTSTCAVLVLSLTLY